LVGLISGFNIVVDVFGLFCYVGCYFVVNTLILESATLK
jgi:hypothetical protein